MSEEKRMGNQEFFQTVRMNVRRTERSGTAQVAQDSSNGPESVTYSARRWAANDRVFYGVSETFDEIPAGTYRCQMTNTGPILIKQDVSVDGLLELPDEASAGIIAEFKAFWRLRKAFSERGFLHKRGFLLWGPPGSGKTSCLQMLVQRLAADHDGVSLIIDAPQVAALGLQMFRHIERRRPLICVMEDIDALVERYGENEFLALLDGEAQVDNVVFVATTNYPERLDSRFVDRPSRFDTIQLIGMPSAAARRRFLELKEPSLSADDLTDWVRQSDGYSLAHLKEMIIAVRCFGQPLKTVVERLDAMKVRRPRSDDASGTAIGFARLSGAA